MKPKHQRLTLAIVALCAIVGAAFLALAGLQSKASYFYTPSDLLKARPKPDQSVRLGGMVVEHSITRSPDNKTINFKITDNAATVPAVFTGIPPELFKEKSGAIAEGHLRTDGVFVVNDQGLLAKHDERYAPPQLDGAMHKTGAVSR